MRGGHNSCRIFSLSLSAKSGRNSNQAHWTVIGSVQCLTYQGQSATVNSSMLRELKLQLMTPYNLPKNPYIHIKLKKLKSDLVPFTIKYSYLSIFLYFCHFKKFQTILKI